MNEVDATHRLARLEGYLREDPANPRLLAEAFDCALQSAAWDRAEFHLRHALALGIARSDWLLREGQWLIAQGRWREAEAHLLAVSAQLEGSPARRATLAHDLAYVALRLGDHAAGIERLAPLVEGDASSPGAADAVVVDASVEVTWLRLLHHAGQLDRAMAWLRAREGRGTLRTGPAGVGSLIALDDGDYAASLRWSDASLNGDLFVEEALVARASLALAARDAALANRLLAAALHTHPDDGRVLSALGFAHLLDQQLPAARAAFDRATSLIPGHIGTWHGLGWAALSQHDLPAARQAFESALRIDRNFAESHGGMAVVCALAGDEPGARAAVARALGLDPHSLSARYAEALLKGEARDVASLRRLAERLFVGQRAPLGGAMSDAIGTPAPKP